MGLDPEKMVVPEVKLKFDGFYISEEQEHVRFVNHLRSTESYWLMYIFYPDGTWICKTAEDPDFPIYEWLKDLDVEAILSKPEDDEPILPNNELLFQSGRWVMEGRRVTLDWRNTNVGSEPMRWSFNLLSENELETTGGEYRLKFKGK